MSLPVFVALAVVPLVVYLRVEPLNDAVFGFWNGQRSNFDFFSFYKARLIVGLAVVALAGLALRAVQRTPTPRLPPVPRVALVTFAAVAIVSAWLSPSRSVALDGFPDRYEGLFVLLSYLVIGWAAFSAIATAADARRVAGWLAASALVIGLIGALQYFGLDPFRSDEVARAVVSAGSGLDPARLLFPTDAGRSTRRSITTTTSAVTPRWSFPSSWP